MADFNSSTQSFYTSNPKVWIWGEWSTTRAVSGNKAGWNVTINLWANRTSGYTTYGNGEVQIEINGTWYKETKYISLSGTAQKLMTKTVFVEGEADEDSWLSGMGVYINIYDVLTCTGNFSIKAKRNKYYAYYYGNGNTDGQSNWWEKVLYGLSYKVQPNWYNRKGHKFKLWNTSPDGSGTDWTKENTDDAGYIWQRNADVHLYAIWIPNKYTVTYKSNYKESTQVQTDSVEFGTVYSVRNNLFTREGYSFVSWNEKPDGSGAEWTKQTGTDSSGKWNVAENIVLYAQWKPNTYTIIYNSNDERNRQFEESVVFGSLYTIKSNLFQKTGSKLIGWNDSPDGKGTDYTAFMGQPEIWKRAKNLTLYAQWERVTNVYIKKNGRYMLGTLYVKFSGKYRTGKMYKKENGRYRP